MKRRSFLAIVSGTIAALVTKAQALVWQENPNWKSEFVEKLKAEYKRLRAEGVQVFDFDGQRPADNIMLRITPRDLWEMARYADRQRQLGWIAVDKHTYGNVMAKIVADVKAGNPEARLFGYRVCLGDKVELVVVDPCYPTCQRVHNVVRTDSCYLCTECGRAAGDGDGFVGQPCTGRRA